jgi:hypothetical protein
MIERAGGLASREGQREGLLNHRKPANWEGRASSLKMVVETRGYLGDAPLSPLSPMHRFIASTKASILSL